MANCLKWETIELNFSMRQMRFSSTSSLPHLYPLTCLHHPFPTLFSFTLLSLLNDGNGHSPGYHSNEDVSVCVLCKDSPSDTGTLSHTLLRLIYDWI